MLISASTEFSPLPAVPRRFFAAGVKYGYQWSLCGIENQGAAIAERDFYGPPIRSLVVALGLCAGGIPFLVEPVQNGFVIGNAPAAFRRRMMKTRSGGGSCRWHGQSGAPAIHSLMACQGGSMGSWCLFRRAAVVDAGDKQCLPKGRGTEGRIDSGSPHSPSPLRGTSPAARVPVQNTYKPSAFFDFLVPNEAADEAHGALAAGALERGSPPHTLRMRSRVQRGRMSRTLRLGGAGIRRIWVECERWRRR